MKTETKLALLNLALATGRLKTRHRSALWWAVLNGATGYAAAKKFSVPQRSIEVNLAALERYIEEAEQAARILYGEVSAPKR